MLVIRLDFLTGRYHTTPWGRNVNEGVPEWPPSPYRLARALIDTWKRKRPDWSEDRVRPLIEAISSAPPMFHLPPATAFSTRAFLSENAEDVTKKQMVFDPFVALDPKDGLFISWPDAAPSKEQRMDLDELLSALNYLGRSESWVSARIDDGGRNLDWNCYPAQSSPRPEDMQTVQVAMPVPRTEYEKKPYEIKGARKTEPRKLDWLESLCWTTQDMFKTGMSIPPAFRYTTYLRGSGCFDVVPVKRTRAREKKVTAVLYALESKIPPQVTSTIEVSERVRSKLMGIHKRLVDDPAKVSQKFSGKDPDGSMLLGHRHVFIMPLDMNDDGRLDHLLVRCREEFDDTEIAALDNMHSLWQPNGKPDIKCVPLQWGTETEMACAKASSRFRSETPFVTSRHYRKGRGDFGEWLAGEVKREAKNQGLPEPIRIEPLSRHDYFWLEFRRSRKGEDTMIGYGFELEFSAPVAGPFTLGYGAHFGLGLFVPVKEETSDHDT